MKRDLYTVLQNWKTATDRKPLILRGARQVGKTHLLINFGHKEYQDCIYLNFEADPKLAGLFAGPLKPSQIINNLSLYLNHDIQAEGTLLIFDEIQECPEALNSLKYFNEEANEFHIAAAGSLLGIKLSHIKGFPVGKVDFLNLYPLSFFEFLTALGKEKLRAYLTEIDNYQPIAAPLHQELITLLKHYMFVGGMPEAVADYSQNQNILNIRKIQKAILDAYQLDFAKHAPKEQVMKITQVWETIPAQLAKENKKFIFSAIHKSARAREYEAAIQWLADAGLIHKSYCVNVPKLPLAGFADRSAFKVFLLDVGLLSAMSGIPPASLVSNDQLFSEFQGAFTENYVAQELITHDRKLYYWTSTGTAEVDFLIEEGLSVYPFEVKAGISRKKKSLFVYGEKFSPTCLLRSSLLNLRKDGQIANLPLYLIHQLSNLIKE